MHRCVFYNVENYFDASVDSVIDYNEFTPDGTRHWSYSKYKQKRAALYKVLTAIGGWNKIALAGFAEIENRFVLEDLIENTPFGNENYQVVHFESDDDRGIDVGLIYHPDLFSFIFSNKIRIIANEDPEFNTRDILYVKGLLGSDTLHVFINHWPSRYGGLLRTKPYRKMVSLSLKQHIDSLCEVVDNPNILVMGDFNDDPQQESIKILTGDNSCKLVGLPMISENKLVEGTMKYQGTWEHFDQIIVSEALIKGQKGLITESTGNIFDASFLLEEDTKYLGVKPYRTYVGYKYNGGISDHLPIFVDIYTELNK